MKQYALILLSAALSLTGCGDNESATPAPATEADSTTPASGVWVQEEQVLVLESNGDFYLPSDPLRQGLSWEQDGGRFTFRYLDSNALSVEQRTLDGRQQDDSLTLEAVAVATDADADADADSNAAPENEEQDNVPLFAGTFQRDSRAVGYLEGAVALPDSAELPQQAVLTVSLLSGGDVVLRRVIRLNGDGTRYPFRLYYPADAVDTEKAYQISTQILAGGGIFYQSELTDLSRDGQQFNSITLPLDPVMNDSETLRGALIWQQDTPVLVLCNSDQRLQIAGPQGKPMIKEVRQQAAYPQQPRVTTVSGVRRKIPGEQEGSTQAAVAVESYTLAAPGELTDCQFPSAELTNTRWVLSHLGNEPVALEDAGKPPFLVLNDSQAKGNGACNSFQGSYQLQDDRLAFQNMASTEMACPALDTEQAFYRALEQSTRYRIDGELLTLFGDDEQPLASFQALYL